MSHDLDHERWIINVVHWVIIINLIAALVDIGMFYLAVSWGIDWLMWSSCFAALCSAVGTHLAVQRHDLALSRVDPDAYRRMMRGW